jgi:hypothetical protein
MGVDLSRIASSALEAALDDGRQPQRKKHGSALKAVAAGAALAVAAKAAASKVPRLAPIPSLDGLRDIPDRVRDRLADAGWLDDETDVAGEPLDVLDEDEGEPLDVLDEDEDLDEEEDEDEPEADADEDFDDPDAEDDADEDESFDDDEDVDEDEDYEEDDEEEPPELLLDSQEDDEDLDPAMHPPKPPRSKSGGRR